MNPITFPECNASFCAPSDLDESQVFTIGAYHGIVQGGSLDGCQQVVTAWLPTERELELLKQGKPIFLSFIGGLPPHYPSMSFEEATHPG